MHPNRFIRTSPVLDQRQNEEAKMAKELEEQFQSIRDAAEKDPAIEDQLVDFLTNKSAGMYLTGANQSSPLRMMTPAAFQKYFDNLYAELGGPDSRDPLHRMMVEQLVMAHHAIGRLIMNSSNCHDTDLLRTQCTLSVQLMAEFRRITQAVNSYEPRKNKPFTPRVAREGQEQREPIARRTRKGVA